MTRNLVWIGAALALLFAWFVVVVLFALRGSAAASIGTLISSTVNQWTRLRPLGRRRSS